MTRNFGLRTYLSQLEETPFLSDRQEKKLARQARAGSQAAKNKLIAGNLRLVVKIAASFLYKGLSFHDLISEGNLGLIHAVDKFDQSRGYRFATYARWWIIGYIRRALNNHGQTVRLPASMIAFISRWKKASIQLSKELGREPYYDELINRLKPSLYIQDAVKKLIRSDRSRKHQLKPHIIPFEPDDFVSQGELRPKDNRIDYSDKKLIEKLLSSISPREAMILNLHYGLDHKKQPLSLRQIANKINLSAERIRQIEERAIRKMQIAYQSGKNKK